MGQSKEPVIERITSLIMGYPSRSAAARAWGININTLKSYYRKEGNIPEPRDNLLPQIATSEGVRLDWLRDGKGESPFDVDKSPKSTKPGDNKLTDMLSFLTSSERQRLTEVLARKGVETVLYLLDEDNIKLLQLDRVVKAKILGMQSNAAASLNDERAKESGSDSEGGAASASLTGGRKQAV
ncbi:hypothetical protein [Candidatus Symbiopectobacterium sp. 'North America']|uniref:hypothetical protein n=1 Tax=Candidatus Symbiopectobacterium sp. 'North America' TaxID=2794574 RepID=UPI001FCFC609|nr:hypothetical protein [Candidatus Symbiopectobacterium sp. 'North America']